MGIFSALGRLFSQPGRTEADTTSLARIREQSEHFRILLGANHQALDAMTELSEATGGLRPVTMPFVKAAVVKATAGTRVMVDRLCRMRPGEYDLLKEALASVIHKITTALEEGDPVPSGPLVIPLDELDSSLAGLAGPKAAGMGEMALNMGLPIPEGFVITASACARLFESGLGEEIERIIQSMDARTLEDSCALSARLTRLVCSTKIPGDVSEAMRKAVQDLEELFGPGRYAVRSSALAEDLKGASFAGQYRSMLNVPAEHLAEAYLDVVAGLFSITAMAYRKAKGMRDDQALMAVCCMRMVDSKSGGVMYTTDPFGEDPDLASIIAVPGLPKGVADGDLDPDEWLVSRLTGEVERYTAGSRSWRYEGRPDEGVERVPSPQDDAPLLSAAQLAELAEAAETIQTRLDAPQDVEWALERGGGLKFLQCRPLETARNGTLDLPIDPAGRPTPLIRNGKTGAGGAAFGPVHLMRKEADMFSFPQGGVLTASTASPRYAPLIPKAAAIVAEHGSKAGHLANVAREFGIPALFGAAGCTDTLQNGMRVTVDADAGCVYPGEHPDMVRTPKRRLDPESPIIKTLQSVLVHVTPLNLTDPDSPDFTPQNCWTLHDVTRFCHEKSVLEMFGRDTSAPGASLSKRLSLNGRPMQYWVVDLEGDLCPKDGKYVELSTIDCPPMQAIWHGMTAIPWAGPPITGKGLMSVLAESAFSGGPSSIGPGPAREASYFLIGRHHCTLQSRFGFHFSTVEGFAGRRAEENYALMQFMGGAADPARRRARVDLCAEILDKKGFITSIRGDVLLARREHMTREDTLAALAVLGYLLMHTRQLDMAMGSEDMRRKYADSFLADLRRLARMDMHADRDAPAPEKEHGNG